MSKERELYKQSQRRLVSTLIANSSKINRVLEIVNTNDIEEPNLELIFNAMTNIARRNEEVSAVTVASELESTGELAKTGGIKEIYTLRNEGQKYILDAQPEIYAQIVKNASARSKVSSILTENKELFKDDSGISVSDGIAELLSQLNSELYGLSDDATSVELNTTLDDYFEKLKERKVLSAENAKFADGLQGIPSLIPSINRYTTGWLPGQLITLGARTGIGKSVFAVNSATAAASAGKSVLFFSLEMGDLEIQDRIVASVTGIPMNKLKQGDLSEEDQRILMQQSESIKKMKILIDTDPKVTVDSIRSKALRRAQSEEGLDFIIVDYLQLITPVGRFGSRQEAVADISRNMKLLAKQLEVPIMVLVQVNRESKDDDNNIPRLSQIRESGAIAQDSDIVILLHRDTSLDDSTPHTLVLLEKNRNGEANKTVRCHSNLACSLFREVVKAKDLDTTKEDLDSLDSLDEDLETLDASIEDWDEDLEDLDDLEDF